MEEEEFGTRGSKIDMTFKIGRYGQRIEICDLCGLDTEDKDAVGNSCKFPCRDVICMRCFTRELEKRRKGKHLKGRDPETEEALRGLIIDYNNDTIGGKNTINVKSSHIANDLTWEIKDALEILLESPCIELESIDPIRVVIRNYKIKD